jgi:predicted N-acetyltransferase YhbS
MNEPELPIRAGRPGDWGLVAPLISQAFHVTPDAEVLELEGSVHEAERALLAEDGGTVVGHVTAFTRELTVPGAVLPAAHVTGVAVAPTHRRRRLLTRMMHRQLQEVREAGHETIAVLWASEAPSTRATATGSPRRSCSSPYPIVM